MSDFAKNLKRLRKERNWTQAKVGELLHYGYSAIANYETGRNELSFDDLLKLSAIFDVTTDELLGAKPKNEEENLLHSFRKLNHEKQKIILELIRSLQALP